MPKHKHVVVTAARWETASIVEWLCFNQYIGFDHCYLYCNDDSPDELYQAVLPFTQGRSPFVTFLFFSIQGMQEHMFSHFLRNFVQECEWFAFIDADEFILLRNYESVGKFLASFDPQPDAVGFSSLNAGYNGHKQRPTGSVIENYTRRADHVESFTKNIARADAFSEARLTAAFGGGWWHNIEGILYENAIIVNVLNESIKGYYFDQHNNWIKISTPEFHRRVIDTAFVYHVGMKSEQDMLRRYLRGTGGVYDGQTTWKTIHDQGLDAVRHFLDPFNAVHEGRLLEIRGQMMSGARTLEIIPPPPGANIALCKPAIQSSVSVHSKHQDREADASGVVDGNPDGWLSHCTDWENNPWWRVDLGRPLRISEIRLFNRTDSAKDRLTNICITGSLGDDAWFTIFRKSDGIAFGGVDGRLLIVRLERHICARYVKITKLDPGFLDFDQVEIY